MLFIDQLHIKLRMFIIDIRYTASIFDIKNNITARKKCL